MGLQPAELSLEGCAVTGNSNGIIALGVSSATAVVRVSNCSITGNSYGVFAGSYSALLTRGNNTLEGNSVNSTFNGSFAAK